MIQESEVDQILADLPKAPPDQQAEMRQKLAEWRTGQQQNEADKVRQLFTDPETWGGQWTPEHDQLVSRTLAAQTAKRGIANLRWLAAQENKNPDDIADFMPAYRKAYSQKLFGKPDMSDDEFYSAVKTRVDGEVAREDGFSSLLGDVAINSWEDMASGQRRPTAELVQKYKTENPDFFKGADEASVVSALSAAYDDLQAKFEKYQQPAKMLFDALSKTTGLKQDNGGGTSEMQNAVAELGLMDEKDRKAIYGAVLLAAKRSGFDPKSVLMQVGEALGRGTIGMVNQSTRVTYEQSLRATLEAAQSGARMGTESQQERDRLIAETKQKLATIQIIREVSALAEEADPIRVVSKSWYGQLAEKSVYGAASSVGYLAASAVPVIGPAITFQAIRAGEYERMLNESPKLSPKAAEEFATISALPQALMDRLQLKLLFPKAPAFVEMLRSMSLSKKGLAGTAANFAKRLAAISAAQSAIQLPKNFIPILVDQLGAAMNKDYKKHDFQKDFEDWKDAAPEVIGSMILLSMIGAGIATYFDVKNGRDLTETIKPLRMAGLSEEQAAQVVAEPTPEARDAKLREVWDKRTPENIKEGVKIANEEAAKAREQQKSAVTPTVESSTQADGTTVYTARGADGRVILTTSDAEAAQSAIREETKSVITRSTSGINEAATFINQVNEAIGRGEDVQKLLLNSAPRTLLDEYNANPTPDNLDRLFETVRFFGEDISEPSQLSQYFVKASNRGKITEGIYRSIIRVHEGADATHVMRDFSQDNLKRAIAEGDVSLDWVRGQLAGMKSIKGYEGLKTETDTDVIESFSDVALDYFTGRAKDSTVPMGLRTFLRQLAAAIKEIVKRVYHLKRAIASGEINQNFEQLLATSVGLDVDQIVAMEGQKALRRMQEESLASVRQGEGAQGNELLDVFSGSIKLPDEKSPFYSQDIARVKEALREANKGKTASEKIPLNRIFSNDAPDPDEVLSSFNENGFVFFVVDDLLQAVEDRIRTGKPSYGYNSNDSMQGANYSISTDGGLTAEEQARRWKAISPGEQVAGLLVREHIPNINSIRASLDAFEVIGLREVPMLAYGPEPQANALAKIKARAQPLADRISASNELNPLIFVVDGDTQNGGIGYILEGSHRIDALDVLGKKSFPALVVLDKSSLTHESPAPEVGADYSISKAGDNRVQQALEAQLNRSPDARLAMYERARKLFDEVRARRGTSDDPNKKFASLLQSMGELDAILKVLPAEVRGKVGGFMPLANLGKDTVSGNRESTINKFLEKRIEMVGKALEKSLSKEYDTKLKKILDRSRPAKDEAGKRKQGKLGADVHSLFDTVREALDWTGEKAQARVEELQAEIDKGELSPEDEAHKLQEIGLIHLVYDWNNADAERKSVAIKNLQSTLERGYLEFQTAKAQERERRDAITKTLISSTGKSGDGTERDEQQIKDLGFVGKPKAFLRDLFRGFTSFDQALRWSFGDKSKDAIRLSDMERKAANLKSDLNNDTFDGLETLFSQLAGGQLKGAKLQWEMSQKTLSIGGRTLSQLEAITATLMWRQEDGRRHMIGKLDEKGNPASEWHYNQDFIDEIEAKLSDEAKAVRDYLANQYGAEWETINPIHKQLYGIDLPRHDNYSPLSVKPYQESAGQMQSPLGGSTMSGASSTPSSLMTRGTSIAEPEFRDALQLFISHKLQMNHWQAYASFISEARAILGKRSLLNAVTASGGNQSAKIISSWLNTFQDGGVRDAAAHLALSQGINAMASRAAQMALVGKISTIVVQSTQIASAAAEMPFRDYVSRLSGLLTGNLGWKAAFDSPYIQRRLKEQTILVQQAMKGLLAERPNELRYAVRKVGNLISGADALFTAGTYAIVYDYRLKLALNEGMEQAEAEAFARNEAERITDTLAQPTRAGARSITENTMTGPAARVAWAFGSEPRKNIGLLAYAIAKRPAAEKLRTVGMLLIGYSLLSTLLRTAWKDLKDPSDEEIFDKKLWNPSRLAVATMTDNFNGLPLVGGKLQSAAMSAAGQYAPNGDLLSGFTRGIGAVKRLPETLQGKQELEDSLKDANAILGTLGFANADIAAIASFSNLATDLFGVGTNVKTTLDENQK